MKISFTGTRKGMNVVQKKLFVEILDELDATEFYHGDCIGADEDAHRLVLSWNSRTKADIKIKKRPCTLEAQRAWTVEGECIADPERPLDRNRKLMDDGETTIATPGENFEELRSGTWAAIRYAKRTNKPIIIIWPNGHVLK